jgi:aminopeptidase 2
MGNSRDPKLIDETLEYIVTKARDQDVIYFVSGLSKNPKDRRIAAEFLKKNYDAVGVNAKSASGGADLPLL